MLALSTIILIALLLVAFLLLAVGVLIVRDFAIERLASKRRTENAKHERICGSERRWHVIEDERLLRKNRAWGRLCSALTVVVIMPFWTFAMIRYSMAYDTGVDGPQLFGMFGFGVMLSPFVAALIGYGFAPLVYASVAPSGWRRYWHGVVVHAAIGAWMYVILLSFDILGEAGAPPAVLSLGAPLLIPIVTVPLWFPASLAGTLVYGFATSPVAAAPSKPKTS